MHPLDTLVWTALSTRLARFAEGGALARRMRDDVGPFAGAADNSSPESVAALVALAPKGGDISLLEPSPPAPPPGVTLKLSAPGVQMVASNVSADRSAFAIEPLGDADAPEMMRLAALTRPGPFRARTHTLGRFLGVRDNGRLVAMAGERLQIDGFIEVSGVCTHPDYRGRGYAAALSRAVASRILADGATPFLHAYASNTAAIALYQQLGFDLRCTVTHAVWERD